MKTIHLIRGICAIVDDADYKSLNRFKWSLAKNRNYYYATRAILSSSKKQSTVRMHRVILKAPKNTEVDHINMDGLDNQRLNLRLCNHSENGAHQKLSSSNTTGFKGVSIKKQSHKKLFRAYIRVKQKSIHLGYYATAKGAAWAYDAAAIKHFGKFALTNEMLGLL